MKIEELQDYKTRDVQDMDRLMHELSATSFCNEEILDRIVRDENSHLFVVRNGSESSFSADAMKATKPSAECSESGRIIACACLCVAHTPEFTLGFVESVTVISDYRGQHLGRILMEHLMAEAKRHGVQHLHLTSNPKRIAANVLYRKLGFVKYETNCYHLDLED